MHKSKVLTPNRQMKITGKTLYSGKGIETTALYFTDGVDDYETVLPGNYFPNEINDCLVDYIEEQDEYFFIESLVDEELKADRLRVVGQMVMEEEIVNLENKAA